MSKSKFLTTAAGLTLIGVGLMSVDGFARDGERGMHGRFDHAPMALLDRLDSNADDVLSPDEFGDRSAQSTERQFNAKDADSDNLLSQEEFAARGDHRRRPNLAGLDADALDLCVEQALGYQLPEPPDFETAFAAADINSDGSLDLDEFLAAGELRAEERFANIDNDGDAQLTSDEIDAYLELRREQRDVHHGCAAEQLEEDNLLN